MVETSLMDLFFPRRSERWIVVVRWNGAAGGADGFGRIMRSLICSGNDNVELHKVVD